ncbi:hypothetical protein EG347_17715 [Chryseobacterium sp. G0186]|uniref:hypothetical protein n=1 Tax=Chryseobacterium sp. G0186 TaxID=2487064 RepID=UPI000F4E1688|nr:hypothetical protein [Chryseobacterium sp. G0186]AZA79213.1 hypothetical protein EG347_17715 [Chryseobacterium sp. G0186]
MKNYTLRFLCIILILSLFIFSSCKNRELNYITYYNNVNKIDSIYRFKKDTLSVIEEYRKLFRKYAPRNQERIQEYETYIILADKYHKNFGGKKSLYKLIPLIAPYDRKYKDFYSLYKRHGIDSMEVRQKIAKWRKSLNKQLVDSFTIAFIRDQQEGRGNFELMRKNDKKNARLLKWTFENYGYPSLQKISFDGNKGIFMPMANLLSHMPGSEHYPYFEKKILEYVKSGECPPYDYATMVDRQYLQFIKKDIPYGVYRGHGDIKDSVKTNYNRRSIGLPGLKHTRIITKDFFINLKKKKLH